MLSDEPVFLALQQRRDLWLQTRNWVFYFSVQPGILSHRVVSRQDRGTCPVLEKGLLPGGGRSIEKSLPLEWPSGCGGLPNNIGTKAKKTELHSHPRAKPSMVHCMLGILPGERPSLPPPHL